MVTVAQRMPRGGETIIAKSFSSGWGGKGANQAVAAARLCNKSTTHVRIISAVGDDAFSSAMLRSLEEDSIDVSGVNGVETTCSHILRATGLTATSLDPRSCVFNYLIYNTL
jgi:ribokinase